MKERSIDEKLDSILSNQLSIMHMITQFDISLLKPEVQQDILMDEIVELDDQWDEYVDFTAKEKREIAESEGIPKYIEIFTNKEKRERREIRVDLEMQMDNIWEQLTWDTKAKINLDYKVNEHSA